MGLPAFKSYLPAFSFSGSLRFLISLQVLQYTFFHFCYVIDNHDVSCYVVRLVVFVEASICAFESRPDKCK